MESTNELLIGILLCVAVKKRSGRELAKVAVSTLPLPPRRFRELTEILTHNISVQPYGSVDVIAVDERITLEEPRARGIEMVAVFDPPLTRPKEPIEALTHSRSVHP